eukprot:TRINITY_DN2022_c5_g3_i2.p1 TRINITY_DN2022_c5_g3~~TRINITY_DN2022_c5_g3_i2.p1  ORF type:complete len:203 (+),score=52.56 TRINITY_DN2022_c5_g3_i2:56-610(+)
MSEHQNSQLRKCSMNPAAFAAMCTITTGVMVNEYLQILNLYGSGQWATGLVPVMAFLLTCVVSFVWRQNVEVNVPFLVAHFMGAAGLLFWSIEWWNTSTRHRTEYFDTHVSYFLMCFAVLVLSCYRYYDCSKEKKIWTSAELAELHNQLSMLSHEPIFEPLGKSPQGSDAPTSRCSEPHHVEFV